MSSGTPNAAGIGSRTKPLLPRRSSGETSTGSLFDGRGEAATPVSRTLPRIGSTIAPRPGCRRTAYSGISTPRTGSTGRTDSFFGQPKGQPSLYFAFNHDRPAFKGAGQIPLEKAINYGSTAGRSQRAYGYLAGKRTDQMLPSALGRDESIDPLAGADRRRPGGGSRRPSSNPSDPPLREQFSDREQAAQDFQFELKRIGIRWTSGLRARILFQKIATRGEPFDVAVDVGPPSTSTPRRSSSRCWTAGTWAQRTTPTSPTLDDPR